MAEAGATLGDSGTAVIWLKNPKGVTLHMKTSGAKGIVLSIGVEGTKLLATFIAPHGDRSNYDC